MSWGSDLTRRFASGEAWMTCRSYAGLRRVRVRLLGFAGLCTLVLAGPSSGVELRPGFAIETAVSGLEYPTALAIAPESLFLIAEKSGRVRVARSGVLQSRDFIDLSNEVNAFGDRGLTGIAIHPRFPELPLVYLAYSYDPPGLPGPADARDGPDGNGPRLTRIVSIEADPLTGYATAVEGSLRVVMGAGGTLATILSSDGTPGQPLCEQDGEVVEDCLPSDSPAHGAGGVSFGPDGALYVGHGDGSDPMILDTRALRAQDPARASGKIFRVDPITGEGLPDNPFFDGNPVSNASRVWSYGLRNPFRFSFHPETGEIFIGDVGWNSWEEINSGSGRNFGWPCFEGDRRQPAFENLEPTRAACLEVYENAETVAPVYFYRRPSTGGSLILGEFYSGASYPARYRNALFFADFNDRWLRTLEPQDSGVWGARPFGFAVGATVHMVQGPDGNLYIVAIDSGRILRLVYNGSNAPPVAVADATPESGAPPLDVQFSSAGSHDPEGGVLSWRWDFGDGETSTESDPGHTYASPGLFEVRLTVTDEEGAEDIAVIEINAGVSVPAASILAPASGSTYAIGDEITMVGEGDDTEDGSLEGDRLEWNAILHHAGHEHPDWFRARGSQATMTVEDHGDDTWLELILTATDSGGLAARDRVVLRPRLGSVVVQSEPAGMSLVYGSAEYVAPFFRESPLGAERVVAAPLVQEHRSFDRWSDGGERSHSILIGTALQTITAYYVNRSPRARLRVSPTSSGPSLRVSLDGLESEDPEGSALSYEWDFGDGTGAVGAEVVHDYAAPGWYLVRLTVRDVLGGGDVQSFRIPVGFETTMKRGVRRP